MVTANEVRKHTLFLRHLDNQNDKQDHHQHSDNRPDPHFSTRPPICPVHPSVVIVHPSVVIVHKVLFRALRTVHLSSGEREIQIDIQTG